MVREQPALEVKDWLVRTTRHRRDCRGVRELVDDVAKRRRGVVRRQIELVLTLELADARLTPYFEQHGIMVQPRAWLVQIERPRLEQPRQISHGISGART